MLAFLAFFVIGGGILFYQALIFGLIVASGPIGRWIVAPLACVWTLTHVFFPPLMILQYCVIALAFVCASKR
ncbi:hypothetical protein RZ964_002534 [Acinetobacter baumannii]|uniref:hypothetical protein n=1 Tax=Acinetobacter baumannii TaxID=470 RepID=UPI002927C976|nr:hypothetical protein [Acinetobacter baumannii]ELT0787977.1 hypothetical protein [Acinetobacter baumannii]MDV7434226.1 hypothetical protein [Acinetobacter baumannii]HCE0436518.1 hypothetical protein [Acinetobacter baumannii]